jgi:glycosyltransferase involved in cell wall biosynthesis
MATATVSVIMVTYRHEDYIQQAINSVLEQDCTHPFELIIANDNSPDGTNNIVVNIINEHPQGRLIKYTRHRFNMGMMNNFIWAVNQGKGKYIALCEGDDYWTDPNKLQKQVDFLESNPEHAGCAHQSMVLSRDQDLYPFKESVPLEITINDIIGSRLFHTSTLVFNRDVLNVFLNAPTVYSGDRLLFFCIAVTGKFCYFPKPMGVYRVHGSGASSNSHINQIILDLNSIRYLKGVYPQFPATRYASYVYATVGLCKNGSLPKRMYYLFLSFLYSFSYFPGNILNMFRYIKRHL